jgi:hypothetical protein
MRWLLKEGKNMKSKKTNAEVVWKQFEDVMVPRLDLCLADRVVYSHLVRHSQEARLPLFHCGRWSEPPTRNTRVAIANYAVPKTLKAAIGGARMKSPSEEPSSSIPDC